MDKCYSFGPFELNVRERTLSRLGARIPLSPKQFDALLLLIEQAGKLVEKDTLLESVWADVHVEPTVLTRTISDLRKALQQSEDQLWIETVPKFGYRFVGKVTQVESVPPTAPAPERQSRATVLLLILSAAALAILLILVGSWRIRQSAPTRIAVLPFSVIGSQEPDVLSLGIADALITRLSTLQAIVVRPISAVRPYAGGSADSIKAGKDLQVDLILEGTLQTIGNEVRVSARLIRQRDGTAVWAGTVESKLGRLFTVEDSLAQQVAANLTLRLPAGENPSLRAEAHELYAKGRFEWGKRTREGFENSATYFQRAIDADPNYARAYSGLADSYLLLGGFGFLPQLETLPKAKALALRALDLNPRLGEAEATLGLVTQNLSWDMDAAANHYRKAIALTPGYATAHHWYAEFLSILGRFAESHSEFSRARQIDPLSPIIQADEAQLYHFERRQDGAEAILRQVLQMDPGFELARERLAFVYLAQGREKEALSEVLKLRSCPPDSDCRKAWTAWLPGLDPQAANQALQWLESESRKRHIHASAMVVGYARQGDLNRSLDWMERMTEKHEFWLITAKVNPLFDPLRGQSRFGRILAKLRLT